MPRFLPGRKFGSQQNKKPRRLLRPTPTITSPLRLAQQMHCLVVVVLAGCTGFRGLDRVSLIQADEHSELEATPGNSGRVLAGNGKRQVSSRRVFMAGGHCEALGNCTQPAHRCTVVIYLEDWARWAGMHIRAAWGQLPESSIVHLVPCSQHRSSSMWPEAKASTG